MYLGNRNALSIGLSNINEVTGRQEVVMIVTTQLRSGGLLYAITVSPQSDFGAFQETFRNILSSVQLSD